MMGRGAALGTVLGSTRPVPRALAGLAGFAVLTAWAWPPEAIAPAPPPPPAPARSADSGGALHRPVFDPSRRAWTARGTLAYLTPGAPVRPVLRVRGILMSDGGGRALIEEEGAGHAVWLAPGDVRAGWTVASVEAERVTVSQDGRSYDLAFLGEPAVLEPPRRRRSVAPAPPEAAAPIPLAEMPTLRLAPEAPLPGVRTIPITPPRP